MRGIPVNYLRKNHAKKRLTKKKLSLKTTQQSEILIQPKILFSHPS